MNQYSGYQGRKSGTGGGCGCGCNGVGSNPISYQPVNIPMYQSLYQPAPAPSPELLRMLEDAVAGENEDQIFYEQLIALAPTKAEKDIIAGIRDDEMSHNKQFRQMYRELTGNEIILHDEQHKPGDQPLSYIANLRKALFGEIAAVKKYRVIRALLTSKHYRDIMFNIITDELTHMGQYNYLITINIRH